MSSLGPVEYIVVGFAENKFDGTIVPALNELVDKGIVRVLDLVFILKDSDGRVSTFEFEDVPGDADKLAELKGEAGILLSESDVERAAERLAPNSSAALLVWEDSWAVPFVEALTRSGGELLDGGRVSAETVEEALAFIES